MQYYKHKTYLLGVLLLFNIVNLQASEKTYFEDSKRGWFWGEKKPIEETLEKIPTDENKSINFNGKEYKTIQTTTNIPWEILDKLHPDEILQLEVDTRNIAVVYPTQENMVEYKKLQKFISNQAMGFVDTSYLVTKQNAEISNWASDTSMNSRLVIDAKRTNLWEKQRKVISEHKKDMIILVATLPTCPYCKEQMPLLKEFENEFGVEFKEVDISKNKEFAVNYQVQKTPDLFLLYRDKGDEPLLTRFGNGLHTIQDLKSGILASLYSFKKISQDYLEY